MTFPPPLELSLFGLYEPGVPGKERIVLRPTESVNLAQFGIMLGWKLANGNVVPINDNFFWFREMIAVTPSWIIIFTGEGEFNVTNHPQTKQPMYIFYWKRKQTIFHNSQIVPVVFQFSTILIGQNDLARLPQKAQ